MILFSTERFDYLAKDLLKLTFMDKGAFVIERFRNRELHAKINSIVRGEHCLILATIAPPEENLVQTLLLAHTLKKEGAHAVTLIAPYLAYCRHDKDKIGESLGVKFIGKLLQASGIDDIWTLDPHSQAAVKLLSLPVVSLSADELFAKTLINERLLFATPVAPDTGAMARCNSIKILTGLTKPIVYFEKTRTKEGIAHIGPIGKVGTKAVVMNDMLDTGETLISVCRKLKQAGAKEIYIMVTHGLFTGTSFKKLWDQNVKKIYCTDTIPTNIKSRRIRIVSILPILEDRLRQQAESAEDGELAGGVAIGVDTWEEDLSEEPAAIFPVKEEQRLEVRTNRARNPAETDESDSQYEGKLWGTPDDMERRYGEEQKDKFIEKNG